MIYFSVILPVYNIEAYIEKCLESLLRQAFTNFELIIIDDGSTDSSGLICDEYQTRFRHCQVLHTQNQGVSSARNYGLSRAIGKYVVFVDGDDIVDIHYLETFRQLLSHRDDVDLAICGVIKNGKNIVLHGRQNKNGYWTKEVLLEELVDRNSVRGFLVNKAFRTAIISENQILFDTEISMCEDLLFCVQFANCCQISAFKNLPLYSYVQRNDSASHMSINSRRLSVLKAYEKIIRLLEQSGNIKAEKNARVNLLLHFIDIYLAIRNNMEYPDVLSKAEAYISDNKSWLMIPKIHIKTRIRGFWAIILVFFDTRHPI